MQVVGLVARFQETTKETNIQAIKMIFIYLKGTLDFGLWYPLSDDVTLVAYTYANLAWSTDDIEAQVENHFS